MTNGVLRICRLLHHVPHVHAVEDGVLIEHAGANHGILGVFPCENAFVYQALPLVSDANRRKWHLQAV